MIDRLWHPSFEQLSRYVDRELDGTRKTRVAAHLSACANCQDTLRFIQDLARVARELPVPEPAEDALERVLARRAAGDRVILPTTGAVELEAPRRRRRLLPIAASIIPLLISSALLVLVPRLSADRSRLDLTPALPRPGEPIRVAYESGALLGSEERLALRARYRFASGRTEQLRAAELVRADDGTFRGTVVLPDSVVYASFAVEDLAGTRVDDNVRRLWEVLVADERGRPRFDALQGRRDEVIGRNWEAALATVRMMVETYPDRVEGWSSLLAFQSQLVGERSRDSLFAAHRDRLHALERQVAAAPPSADQIAGLAIYATALGEDDAVERWSRELVERFPRHPVAVMFRSREVAQSHRRDAARQETELDRLWEEVGAAHRSLAMYGLRAAVRTGDPAAVLKWSERFDPADPEGRYDAARVFARFPELGPEGVRRARAAVSRLLGPIGEERNLRLTVDEQRLENERLAGHLLAALGDALIAVGRVEAGLDTLRLAGARGWDPELFEMIARSTMAAGDTLGAIEFLARVAVDPLTPTERVDAIAETTTTWLGPDAWRDRLDRARTGMRDRIMERASMHPIRGDVELLDLDGQAQPLDAVLGGEVILVAFWSRGSGPALSDVPMLNRIAGDLAVRGVRVIAVVGEAPSPELGDAIAEIGLRVPVLTDPEGEVGRLFRVWGTPAYHVVDRQANRRFDGSTLPDAWRQAIILNAPTSPLVATASWLGAPADRRRDGGCRDRLASGATPLMCRRMAD